MTPLAIALFFGALLAAAGAFPLGDASALLQAALTVDRAATSEGEPTDSTVASGSAKNGTGEAAAANGTAGATNATAAGADATAANATVEPHAPPNATENETGWCGFQSQPGFITAYTMAPTDNLLLDLTEGLQANKSVRFVVTAMSVSGTYADGQGYLTEFASPMEETANTMFELRLGADNISVDVFRPQLDLRTSDQETLAALRRGTGNGHFETLGTYRCARRGPGNFMSKVGGLPVSGVRLNARSPDAALLERDNVTSGLEGAPAGASNSMATMAAAMAAARTSASERSKDEPQRIIISGGSLIRRGFFVANLAKQASGYRLLSVKSYKSNLDVAVEYMMPDGLPLSVGFSLVRLPEKPMHSRPADERLLYFTTDYKDLGEHSRFTDELPEESVDRKVSTIWRYNLPSLPDNQIRIHIDPTVPKRWRRWFREGVEAWNQAFKLMGMPKAVKAVLPGDPEWPADYDISDARFSTISWTISSQVVSMGIAKVDPRSGEILKSDIVMSDGWVRSWLGDLDLLAPNFTHQLDQTMGYRFEACSDGNVILGRRRIPGRLRVTGDWGKKISLLSAAVGKPVKPAQRDDILGEGLRHVVTHETGHILGLRHNFKGSLGVSYSCIRSASCTALRGLTASVMDYVPVNYPSADAPDVHLFSPVLGEYDKLAIRYGYSEEAKTNGTNGEKPSSLESTLANVLTEAENFATCYDSDRIQKQDPACAAYDMSADPIQYYEDELKRLADVQRNLLNTSVMPGAPYTHYGDAVDTVLMMAESTGVRAVDWLGGVNNQYVYRRPDGRHAPRVSRKAVPAAVQKRALALVLRIVRPTTAGLMPPDEALPYLVTATQGSGSVASLDLAERERVIGRVLLTKLLSAEVLQRLHAEEQLQGGVSGGLSIGEFLALIAKDVLKDGFSTTSRSEWDLQRLFIKGLAKAYSGGLPNAAAAHVAVHLQRLRREVASAVEEASTLADSESDDDASGEPSKGSVLRAHLLSLHQDVHSALCDGTDTSACSMVRGAPSAAVRPVVAPVAATALAALLAARR